MDRGIIVTKAAVFALAILLAGSATGLAAQQSGLEKLLNVAPDDVFAIAGTSGGSEVGPGFKDTVIGKMWADAQTQAFYTQVRDAIVAQLQAKSSPKDANQIATLVDTAKFVFNRPCVAGVAMRPAGANQVPAYFFVLVNAGPVKEEFAARLKKIEEADWGDIKDATFAGCKMHAIMPEGSPAVYWGMQGDYFVFAINDPNGFALKHLKTGGSSAAKLLDKVQGNGDVLSIYIDIAKVKVLLQTQFGSNEKYPKVMAFIKSMGLDNIRTYVARTGFVGGEIVTECFIDAPQFRTGIMAAIKPINMKVFDSIDPNCIGATAVNIDTAVIFDTVMNSIKTVDQQAYDEAVKGLADFETESGIKVRDGIIASLAGPVTFYSLPSGSMNMTLGGGGGVLIADLKDQAKFEQNMAAIGAHIAKKSNGSFQVSIQTLGDRKLNVWMIPQMSMVGFVPTWTVVNGKLVFTTNQQMCKIAADLVASPVAAKSLSALPQFRSVTTGLPGGVTYLSYLDNRVYFKMLMSQLQRVWPMATMAASQGGVALPFVLPDLSQYESQMKPGVAWSWSDKDGIHMHIKGSGIEQAVGGVAVGAIGAAVLMPALAKAKEKAQDIVSANNLKQIGIAIHMYADDHAGAFPKELDDLVKAGSISSKVLERQRKGIRLAGPDFIYVTGLKQSTPPAMDSVLVYENPLGCRDKIAVLYLDAHVEYADKAKFKADLKKTYERLGQPMPEVKFMGEGNLGNGHKISTKPVEPNKPK